MMMVHVTANSGLTQLICKQLEADPGWWGLELSFTLWRQFSITHVKVMKASDWLMAEIRASDWLIWEWASFISKPPCELIIMHSGCWYVQALIQQSGTRLILWMIWNHSLSLTSFNPPFKIQAAADSGGSAFKISIQWHQSVLWNREAHGYAGWFSK